MKKIVVIIIGIIIVGLSYWILQKGNKNAEYHIYRDKNYGFEINYPGVWYSYKDENLRAGAGVISTLSKKVYSRGDAYEEFGEDYALIFIEYAFGEQFLDDVFEKKKKALIDLNLRRPQDFADIVIEEINTGIGQGYSLFYKEEKGVTSGLHFDYLLPGKNEKEIIILWGWFRGDNEERRQEYLAIFNEMVSTIKFLD